MASNDKEHSNEENKVKGPLIIVYSDYGYIKVDENEYKTNQLVHFNNLQNNFNGAINKNSIHPTLTINLKTLYGPHKLYSFEVLSTDPIKDLIKKLQAEEDKDTNEKAIKYNKAISYRLISSKGSIKQVDTTKMFYEQNISHNQILILAPNLPVYFSEKNHGNGISIENKSTAHKVEGDEFEMAFIEKGCSFGCSYTEFSLLTEPDEKSIMVGVCLPKTNFLLTDHKSFWGYVLSEAKKTTNDCQIEYGCVGALGDKVGVLINFESDNTVSISFYLNDLPLGIAFDNLPKNTYHPCVVLCYEGAKVKVIEHSPIPNFESASS